MTNMPLHVFISDPEHCCSRGTVTLPAEWWLHLHSSLIGLSKQRTPERLQARRRLVVRDVVQQHLVPVHLVRRIADCLLAELVVACRLLPLPLVQCGLRRSVTHYVQHCCIDSRNFSDVDCKGQSVASGRKSGGLASTLVVQVKGEVMIIHSGCPGKGEVMVIHNGD
jgi:hypothetical protein